MNKTIQTLLLIGLVCTRSFGQCPNSNPSTFCGVYNGATLTVGTVTPVCVMVAGDYQDISNLVAGNTYRISFCNAIGADNPPTNYNSFMTVYGPNGLVGFNDDFCGTNSQVEFVAPTSGTYRVLCNVSGNCAASNFILTPTTITLVNAPSANATVTSINRASTNPSNASVADYSLTFSGSVSGLMASNFTLTTTGNITGASVGTPTGSGTAWTVPVNTGTGDGTIRLDMSNSSGLTPTVTTPYTQGQVYDIDKTPPTISIGNPSASSTSCGPITYTITYVGATAISLSNSDVTVNASGTVGVNVAVSGTGTSTRTVTLSGISGSGPVGISIAANTATDAAGNSALAAGPSTTFAVTPISAGIIPSATSTCVGVPISLNGTGSNSYAWAATGGGFSSTTTSPTTWTPSTSGNYSITLTAGSGTCTATASIAIVVSALPTMSVVTPAAQCGGSVNLSTAFSSDGTLSYFTDNAFTNSAINPVTVGGTYYAQSTLGSCTNSASVAVTINPLPTISVATPAAQCGGSINLSTAFSSNGTLSYFTDNAFTSSATDPVTVGDTYYAQSTLGSCIATASVFITINSSATISVVTPAAQCGGSINLNTAFSSNGTLNYFTDNAFTSSATNPVTVGGTYYARANLSGCTATASVLLTINSAPSITVGSNSPLCAGNVLMLSASGGVAWSWSGPGNFSSNAQTPNRPGVTASMGGVYTVSVSTSNGCQQIATTRVTVNPVVNGQVSSNSPLCVGGTLRLSASGGSSYSWSGPGFSSTQQNPTQANVTLGVVGTYSVTISGACGSVVLTTSVVVSANIAPSITSIQVNGTLPNAQNTVSMCNSQAVSLNITATNAVSYSWRGPTGAGSGFASSLISPVTMPISTPKQGQYTITARNGCSVFHHRVVNIQFINCTNNRLAIGHELRSSILQLNISPNPVTDWLAIRADGVGGSQVYLRVVDVQGRSRLGTMLEPVEGKAAHRFDLRPLPVGLYLLEAEDQHGQRATVKVVKH